jgi:hypothetical protein
MNTHEQNCNSEIRRVLGNARRDGFLSTHFTLSILNRENHTVFTSEVTWTSDNGYDWNRGYNALENFGAGPFSIRMVSDDGKDYVSTCFIEDATLQRHSEGYKTASAS